MFFRFVSKFVAFIVGCLIVFVVLVSAATVAIGFAGYVSVFFPQAHQVVYAVALIGALSFVNLYGIRESVWTNVAFTLIELAGLLIIILAGMLLNPGASIDFFETPATTTSSASAFVLIMSAAGFNSYYTAVYILVAISALDLVGWKELSLSDAPLATAAGKAFGDRNTLMLSIIALFATSNTILMMLVAGSRIIFCIAKDGAFPTKLARVYPTWRTLWAAVILLWLQQLRLLWLHLETSLQ